MLRKVCLVGTSLRVLGGGGVISQGAGGGGGREKEGAVLIVRSVRCYSQLWLLKVLFILLFTLSTC